MLAASLNHQMPPSIIKGPQNNQLISEDSQLCSKKHFYINYTYIHLQSNQRINGHDTLSEVPFPDS